MPEMDVLSMTSEPEQSEGRWQRLRLRVSLGYLMAGVKIEKRGRSLMQLALGGGEKHREIMMFHVSQECRGPLRHFAVGLRCVAGAMSRAHMTCCHGRLTNRGLEVCCLTDGIFQASL